MDTAALGCYTRGMKEILTSAAFRSDASGVYTRTAGYTILTADLNEGTFEVLHTRTGERLVWGNLTGADSLLILLGKGLSLTA